MRHSGFDGLSQFFGAGAGAIAFGFVTLAAAVVATAFLRETVLAGL